MAKIATREEFAQRIVNIIGERNDDEALAFIGDMTETYDSFTSHEGYVSQHDHEEAIKQKDNEWRNKYKAAFLTGKPLPDEQTTSQRDSATPDENDPRTFEELFK